MSKAKAKPAAAAEGDAPKPKSKLIPVVLTIVVLVAAILGGKAVMGSKKPAKHGKTAPAEGSELALDDFLVNLAGNGDHYLRATISLGVRKGVQESDLKTKMAPIRDAILTVLSSQHRSTLNTDQGKTALKTQIEQQVNKELGKDDVVNVYFTAFATQ